MRGHETRVRILEATIHLMAEVGWGGITTRLVAERAGVNNAAVNYYFSTKGRLLRAAALQAAHRLLEEATRPLLEAPDLPGAVKASLGWISRMDLASPEVSVLLETMLQATRDPELRSGLRPDLERFRDLLVERIRAEQDRGRLHRDADPRALAVLLAAALDGLWLHRLVDPSLDMEAVAGVLERLLKGESR